MEADVVFVQTTEKPNRVFEITDKDLIDLYNSLIFRSPLQCIILTLVHRRTNPSVTLCDPVKLSNLEA
jgi:predicted nuclease of predicted toxin-antitoxin system